MVVNQEELLREQLKETFGFSNFRGNQAEIIKNIMSGRNTFVLMPTGAGKSLCYQLPAIIQEGTAIVISPLIALMKNQVDQLNAFGINAQFLNSTLNKTEIKRVKKETLAGEIKLLYVAPESLTKEENVAFLSQAKISFVAIDEAHCISEWGHDFRPEYRRIKSIVEQLGSIPVIALTATATPKVQLDIQKNLQMEDADVFKSSFNRQNLYYEIRPKVDVKKQLIRFVKEHKNKSGVIYCLSRKKVEEIAELLKVNDINAAPYHAGLDASVRMKNQDDFLNEDVDVIVATIAFGMGIDKPDVRFVIHYDTPKSLEGYYQETGRAGRDGLEGKCIMFYSLDDIIKLEKFNKDKPVTERENAKLLLEEMSSYAESSVCRRRQLLHYFGEEYTDSDCTDKGLCDNCSHPKELFEGQEFIKHAIDIALKTEERFGIKHIVDVARGIESQYVKSYDHNTLDVFGVGSSETEVFWRSVVRQTLINEFLEKDIENIGVLKVTAKGHDFLNTPYSIELSKDHDYMVEELESKEEPAGKAHDAELFELLKNLRKKVAKQKNLPPYVIFQDPSLEEMATTYPTSNEDLAQINGVGMGKVMKFGKPFIDLISTYVSDNDLTTASDVVIKSAVNKSKIKIFLIQQIDRKVDLEEIAEIKNMSFDKVLDEIEHICFSGTKLNLDYYIDSFIDEDRQDDLLDYFLTADTDDLEVAMDELEDDGYSEDEVRLMRIKFISEYAN
ncbi:ATP-dependent DNA helicase RecQ [Reichenbachiella sp. 5M10]|uniref:DNA helicase RecQ n=1 Tax=Reichenbachiella sp. 5M10 TaxID=1889772 RepID=UPI000C145A92|nr:DNA helicase RecQ [Reichenbachiella sp. 5M10]PIB36786.1 ATP-dependent DNA helicase RecQ [Reichenbachiella sp. 5M10]